MKLKKKEDQSVGASVFLRKGRKYSQEQLWRKSVEQRLKNRTPRDCPTWDSSYKQSSQNPNTLWMQRNSCRRKPIWLSPESLSELYKYRGRCYQPTFGLRTLSQIEELEKGLKELEGFATSWEEHQCQPIEPPRDTRD